MDCIFCKIISKQIPAKILHETSHSISFLDAFPLVKGHVLVIPKNHHQKIQEMSLDENSDLFVAGEMGIGNTTSAAAIANALYGGTASDWVGRGTGVDNQGLKNKSLVVAAGLEKNPSAIGDGLEALRCLGGRELAAIVGSIASARSKSIPVILDGFICTAAAACLEATVSGSLEHCVAGHESNEQAHKELLKRLDKKPLLSLGMRLGEGSGAALAIGVLKAAIACHSGMATFAQAGVSED